MTVIPLVPSTCVFNLLTLSVEELFTLLGGLTWFLPLFRIRAKTINAATRINTVIIKVGKPPVLYAFLGIA